CCTTAPTPRSSNRRCCANRPRACCRWRCRSTTAEGGGHAPSPPGAGPIAQRSVRPRELELLALRAGARGLVATFLPGGRLLQARAAPDLAPEPPPRSFPRRGGAHHRSP